MIAKKLFLILCNRGTRVILYKLYFLCFHFSSQPNKWVFHLSIFLLLKPITQEWKLNLFYPFTFLSFPHFLSTHFFTPPTKRTLRLHLMSPISHKILTQFLYWRAMEWPKSLELRSSQFYQTSPSLIAKFHENRLNPVCTKKFSKFLVLFGVWKHWSNP